MQVTLELPRLLNQQLAASNHIMLPNLVPWGCAGDMGIAQALRKQLVDEREVSQQLSAELKELRSAHEALAAQVESSKVRPPGVRAGF